MRLTRFLRRLLSRIMSVGPRRIVIASDKNTVTCLMSFSMLGRRRVMPWTRGSLVHSSWLLSSREIASSLFFSFFFSYFSRCRLVSLFVVEI